METDRTKGNAPAARTAGASSAETQNITQRTKQVHFSAKGAIAFMGHWEDVHRLNFPDLQGFSEGHIVAVDAPGYGVLVGSSGDPAYYMLTLGKRYKAKGVNFGTVLVSVPVTDSYAHARTIFYALTGQRSVYASLVERSFDDVRLVIEAHLNTRRTV